MREAVLDNSAAIYFWQQSSFDETVEFFAPELIDLEFVNALRGLVLRQLATAEAIAEDISAWSRNAVVRCSSTTHLNRIWELRNNITPYDASYVALAEELSIPLLTGDRRLAAAATQYCEVVLVGDSPA